MNPSSLPGHAWGWSLVFRIKGAWNCIITIGFFVGEDALRDWLDVPRPDPAYRAMFLALAFTFGLGYWRVGQNITTNRDIVRGGVIGQVSVFTVLAYEVFVAQRLPLLFLVPGLVDLFFAVLFIIFLLRTGGILTDTTSLAIERPS